MVIGREMKGNGFGSVVIENETGTYALLEHVYQLGHREIAFIKGPEALNDSEPRWNGLCTFAKSRTYYLSRLVVQIEGRNSSYEEGYQLTETLLRTGRKFTALITFDDLTAFAAIVALTSAEFACRRTVLSAVLMTYPAPPSIIRRSRRYTNFSRSRALSAEI